MPLAFRDCSTDTVGAGLVTVGISVVVVVELPGSLVGVVVEVVEEEVVFGGGIVVTVDVSDLLVVDVEVVEETEVEVVLVGLVEALLHEAANSRIKETAQKTRERFFINT
jgi:hypothetical protein